MSNVTKSQKRFVAHQICRTLYKRREKNFKHHFDSKNGMLHSIFSLIISYQMNNLAQMSITQLKYDI